MASVFRDAHGIIFIDYLEKGKTINSDYYTARQAEIVKKRPHMAKKKILFHQDTATCHKSIKTMVKLHDLHFELLPYPLYSPDQAPSDCWIFADLKTLLAGKKVISNVEAIAETEAYFEVKDKVIKPDSSTADQQTIKSLLYGKSSKNSFEVSSEASWRICDWYAVE